ncbi:MAG TPA: HIT family protein [Prolixibacteraceae bacterium]|nr:HIT family protein [Prolixibacteraceae bacterium]
MSSIFSKIAAGEIPSYKVAEDADYLAFLDIFPLSGGHVLVIPKKEVDYLFDLDEETYSGLMKFSRRVAIAIGKVIPCKRVGVAVLGLEVPHAHIHLIPLNSERDIDFSRPKLQFSPEEFTSIAKSIADSFE